MTSISELRPGARVYLIGICGTAMASFAGILQDLGFLVSGSDQNVYPPMSLQLQKLKIPIYSPFAAANLAQANPDFVIVGNVVSKNHVEAEELARRGIPFTSMPQALGELVLKNKETFVVSGTHGKTTTSSLLAWTCENLGLEPGYLIGGIPKNFEGSFRETQSTTFVIEGDEYDTAFFDKVPKFTHYYPKHAILTSVEFDHADIYRDLAHVCSAFALLLEKIPADGTLVYHGGDANIREVLGKKARPFRAISYGAGVSEPFHFTATNIQQTNFGQKFSVLHKTFSPNQKVLGEQMHGDFEIKMSGHHNVLNALSVIALADSRGWDLEQVQGALRSFEGVKRRQEVLGVFGGVTLIEDFAHHPTAVRETILGIKKQYHGQRVFAVFEPRSATSRRKVFQKDYVTAFREADFIHLAQAFDQSKIVDSDRFSSEELAQDISREGKPAISFETVDQIVTDVAGKARRGDVILVMSNGGFGGIYQKLTTSLQAISR